MGVAVEDDVDTVSVLDHAGGVDSAFAFVFISKVRENHHEISAFCSG